MSYAGYGPCWYWYLSLISIGGGGGACVLATVGRYVVVGVGGATVGV